MSNNLSSIIKFYYFFKPYIPKAIRYILHRYSILFKRWKYRYAWPIDISSVKFPENWKGWPEGKKFALILTHDVESSIGYDKCSQLVGLEKELDFRSSFNFVPERYHVPVEFRDYLKSNGFEVGIHGLNHDGKLYFSNKMFKKRAKSINNYLKEWEVEGFRSPSMHHNLDWIHDLKIQYDASTFDTDPFEPQSDGMGTIFPMWINGNLKSSGYVELPYTLPQDTTLYIFMKENSIDIWQRKIDWIAQNGGMALFLTHPDFMDFNHKSNHDHLYPVEYYKNILIYIKDKYHNQYWHVLPNELAKFWKKNYNKIPA